MRVAIVVFAILAWSSAARADVTGTWSGTIEIPGQPLAFSVTFADGKGTIDIPSQGATGLALDSVTINGTTVSFAITKVGAVMKGTVDGDTIKGTLEQGGQTIPFKLARGGGYKPPPPPRKPLTASAGAKLLGTWKGKVGSDDLVVELHDENGLVVGTSTSPHACKAIPLDHITLTFKTVHAEQLGSVGIDGTITGDTMSGVLHQAGVDAAWSLKRDNTPVADKPYTETQLTIPSTNGTTLAATLTTPKGPPAPVVVTITGSGPQDRDECVVGIRPFAQLADHLARHGIATLRYDDRGTAKSTGDFTTATATDFADDAQAAVTFLSSRNDIDPKKIGVLGHSEGGIIAPMVAARDKDVAFVVMWAGPGVPLDQVITRQTGEILKADGAAPDKVAHVVSLQQALWKLRHANKDRDKFKAAVIASAKRMLDKVELAAIHDLDAWAENEVSQIWNPWFTWYLDYDPKVTLRKVTQPVLAINGSLDKQVDPTINLPAIKAALAKNKDVSIVEIPGQNHVFQQTKTGSPSEYVTNPPVMDAQVLDVTTAWIRKHTGLE